MVSISIVYQGDLHCQAVHEPSCTALETDAPIDNQGKGASFSPTDLVATALGTCMATTMGIVCRKHGWSIEGVRVAVQKHMTPPPRRIARLDVRIEMPGSTADYDAAVRTELEHTVHTCPVRVSLLPAIEVPVEFVWP
jgi:putative redox protein